MTQITQTMLIGDPIYDTKSKSSPHHDSMVCTNSYRDNHPASLMARYPYGLVNQYAIHVDININFNLLPLVGFHSIAWTKSRPPTLQWQTASWVPPVCEVPWPFHSLNPSYSFKGFPIILVVTHIFCCTYPRGHTINFSFVCFNLRRRGWATPFCSKCPSPSCQSASWRFSPPCRRTQQWFCSGEGSRTSYTSHYAVRSLSGMADLSPNSCVPIHIDTLITLFFSHG